MVVVIVVAVLLLCLEFRVAAVEQRTWFLEMFATMSCEGERSRDVR